MYPGKPELYQFIAFVRQMWDGLHADWDRRSAEVGLSITEEQVLWVIWVYQSTTITDLADFLSRDKGTISKAVRSLEEKGYVGRKNQEDRRFYELFLTSEGDRIRQEIAERFLENSTARSMLEALTEEEFRAFAKASAKMLDVLRGKSLGQFIHSAGERMRDNE